LVYRRHDVHAAALLKQAVANAEQVRQLGAERESR
jgi:hypothetical protein